MSPSNHAGDLGETGYLGKGRLSKSGLRFDTLGSMEEVQALLGVARAFSRDPEIAQCYLEIQLLVPLAMAEVASDPENAEKIKRITEEQVQWLESRVAALKARITLPDEFIIPGKTKGGAFCDLTRAVVRRSERNLVRMQQTGKLKNLQLMKFWNRLSLYLYYLELAEDQR